MATQKVTYSSEPLYRRINYRYDGSGNPTFYGTYYVTGTAISVPDNVTSWTYSLIFEYIDSNDSTISMTLSGTGGDGTVQFTDYSVVNTDSTNRWLNDPPHHQPNTGTQYMAVGDSLLSGAPENDATVSGSITFTCGDVTTQTIYFNGDRIHYISRVVGYTPTSGVNKLKMGDGGVSDVYLGSSKVQKMYLGSTLIYSVGETTPRFGFILQDENYTVLSSRAQIKLNNRLLSDTPIQVGTTTLTIDMEQGTYTDPGAVPVYAELWEGELYVSLDTTIYTSQDASAFISWNWSGTATIIE